MDGFTNLTALPFPLFLGAKDFFFPVKVDDGEMPPRIHLRMSRTRATLTASAGAVLGDIAISAPAATGIYNFVGRWFDVESMAPIGTAQGFQLPQGGGSHTPDASSLGTISAANDYFYLILRVS